MNTIGGPSNGEQLMGVVILQRDRYICAFSSYQADAPFPRVRLWQICPVSCLEKFYTLLPKYTKLQCIHLLDGFRSGGSDICKPLPDLAWNWR